MKNPPRRDTPMFATHQECTAIEPALVHTQLASWTQRRAGQNQNWWTWLSTKYPCA